MDSKNSHDFKIQDTDKLSKAIKQYLTPYLFFGLFFIIAPLLVLIMIIIVGIATDDKIFPEPGLLIFIVAGISAGSILIFKRLKIIQSRKNALSGCKITAKVTSKGRAFAFYRSNPLYTLTVEYTTPSAITKTFLIRSPKRDLHQYNIGDTVNGFWDEKTGSVFFPL